MVTVSEQWRQKSLQDIRPEMFIEMTWGITKKDGTHTELKLTKKDIVSYTHRQQGYVLSEGIAQNAIDFTLDNSTGRWNPNEHSDILVERSPIHVRYGMQISPGENGVEWIKGGTFYLSEWSTDPNGLEARFTATDILNFTLETEYTPEPLGPNPTQLMYDLQNPDEALKKAVGQANIVPEDIVLDYYSQNANSFFINNVGNVLGDNLTVAEVVQMITGSMACAVKPNRDGKIELKRMAPLKSCYKLPRYIEFSHPSAEMKRPIKDVTLVYSTSGEELKSVKNVAAKGESFTITNKLVQTKSTDISIAIDPRNPESLDQAKEAFPGGYFDQAYDRYAIAQNNLVLNTAYPFFVSRKTLSGAYRADPILDLYDVIEVDTKYGSAKIILTELEYTFNGSFEGSFKGIVLSETSAPPEQKPTLGKFVLGTDKLGG